MVEVLGLNSEERKAMEEYRDDSVEPVRGIMERWEAALEEKERIPFQSVPLGISPESLILAAGRGKLSFVRALLAEGVPLDATNEVGYTALMSAARSYRLEVLAFLLNSGADVHHRDIYGHTPLHCAVGTPSFEAPSAAAIQAECVCLLLKHGAVPDARDLGGGTPLMDAAWFGCAPSVECLLRAGANPALHDERGRRAHDLAKERGHEEIASLLERL